MSLPSSWTRVPVTGQYIGRDGMPIVGQLSFLSPTVVEIDNVQIVPRRIIVALDAEGRIPADFTLPSTNDPGLSVGGWAYTVQEGWPGGREPYAIVVPHDGGPISLPETAPAMTAPQLSALAAAHVPYNNTASGLAATNLQAAVDEVAAGNGGGGGPGGQGPKGDKGDPGDSAYQVAVASGFVGTQVQWLASLVGPAGAAGAAGADGAVGPAGPAGPQGEAGPAGAAGAQGPQGERGADGTGISILGSLASPGDLPPTGNTGDAYLIDGDLWVWATGWQNVGSIQGPPGPAGAAGPQGDAGPAGAAGAQGAQGVQGPAGAAGAAGPQGPAGADGAAGPAGAAGEDGADGLSAYQLAVAAGFVGTVEQWLASLEGPTGPAGPAGEQGPAGAAGAAGAQGEVGPQGPAGAAGADGAPGVQGPAGEQGPQGEQGPAGPAGATGADGAQGPAGAAGAQGPAGPQGATGAVGVAPPLGLWDHWVYERVASTNVAIGSMFVGSAISSGTNNTAIPAAAVLGRNGNGVFLRSSTTANSGYRYGTSSVVADYFGAISHKFRCQFLWRTAFTTRTVRMGFHDSTTSADAVDGAYFEVSEATCTAKTASNSTRTSHATTVTLSLDVPYTFDIEVNAAGTSARFRVYEHNTDTPIMDVTIGTNLPTTSARAFGAGITATEASTTATDIGILYAIGAGTIEGFQREMNAAGASAYQVAQQNGFVGSEAAWLATLIGAQGPAGPGTTVTVYTDEALFNAATPGANEIAVLTDA